MPAYASIYTNSICFAASFNTLQLIIRSLASDFLLLLHYSSWAWRNHRNWV